MIMHDYSLKIMQARSHMILEPYQVWSHMDYLARSWFLKCLRSYRNDNAWLFLDDLSCKIIHDLGTISGRITQQLLARLVIKDIMCTLTHDPLQDIRSVEVWSLGSYFIRSLLLKVSVWYFFTQDLEKITSIIVIIINNV